MISNYERHVLDFSETLFTPATEWWKRFKPGDPVTVTHTHFDLQMAVILPDDQFRVVESRPEYVTISWRDPGSHARITLNLERLYKLQLHYDHR